MCPQQIREWRRVHRVQPPVALRVVTSPISGDWLLRVDGWEFPRLFPLLYHSLESAQRAADEVVRTYLRHDCQEQGCGGWGPVEASGSERQS